MTDDRRPRVEQAICDCVEDHRAAGILLLQDLVRTPGYSGQEGVAADPATVAGKVSHAARAHQGEVTAQPVQSTSENIIEVLRGPGKRAFVLEAHTDTVPEGEAQNWLQGQPFSGVEGFVAYLGDNRVAIDLGAARYEARIRGQMARVWEQKRTDRRRPIVYGRGSFDNKGSVVATLLALNALAEALPAAGVLLNGSVIGAYTVDEEANATGVKRFACGKDSWLGQHGFLDGPVDAGGFLTEISGIALDGSYGWVPVVGHRGSVQLTITVHGRSAHAATPHLGVNAVEQMARILLCLVDGREEVTRRLLPAMDPSLLGPPSLAIGTTVAGGGVWAVRGRQVERGGVNSIPDWCEATLDIRFPVGHAYPRDVADQYEAIYSIVRGYLAEQMRPREWSYEVRMIEGANSPPVALGRNVAECAGLPIVRQARDRAEQLLGYAPDLEIAPGGTDATFMIHEARIPTLVEFGPAGALSHNVHEFVERDDVIAGAKIMALLALDVLDLAA